MVPYTIDINRFVKSIKTRCDNFVFTNKLDKNKFLGIEITQLDENSFKIYQPFLINRIISFLNINTDNYGMDTNNNSTLVVKPLPQEDLSGKMRK